ncbi:MAG TPA: acetate/propionate family kinase [Acidimicrobiales bacterium]|nr:acetate/propionate family kinase [Acidimicrobiales bacterium]
MRVLAVNVGSSSLKLRVIADDDRLEGKADLPPLADLAPTRLQQELDALGPVDAIGHRVVHGGERFTEPVLVDDAVLHELRGLVELAPLHQPAAIEAIEAVGRACPGTPAVACFDTAFHTTLSAGASTYAVPQAWRALGVRRYGFHGLSHSWASRRAAQLLGRPLEDLRLVTCHLGAGASLAAVLAGRSVDTTMGFTPLEGLVMATRSGSIDPGALLWLQQRRHLGVSELSDGLERDSGLAGLCGTGDMREVTDRARAGDADAGLALEVYLHRLRASIAAMTAALGALDAVVFTGGVGENSSDVRAGACRTLGFLGVQLATEDGDGDTGDGDRVVSTAGTAAVVVVEAREDLEIAAGVRALCDGDRGR